MNPERWRKIDELVNEALDLPASSRAAFLEAACGEDAELKAEVRSLVESAEASEVTIGASVREAIATLPATAVRRAGPYELIEEIGRGGMGTVYKARRADQAYDAIVVVKLVRPGLDTDFVLSRFRQERQTLAKLNHPNIARLLDGGTAGDGVPYIVMEYIDGLRINEYCQREQLSLEQRLRLMLPVCLATDYAHRNFIVHRDIKPGNVMVDAAGTPKLLDFGICKLLESDSFEAAATMTMDRGAMTPDYASPEQVLGEAISTRSDVYSLGAVLYELLTGKRPHKFEKFSLLAIEEAVCRAPITLPSQAAEPAIARHLRGDLDNIVMRALEKDPQRRYESAAALSEDIRRYLDREPVSARPAGMLYRAGKFVSRHRALTAAVAVALTASTVGTFVSLRQARRAEAREAQIRSMARVFLFDVHDSIRDLPGATAARQKVVQHALAYLGALAGSNPSDPAILRELAMGYQRIADVQGSDSRGANLGEARPALANYGKAIGYWDAALAGQPDDREGAVERVNALRRSGDLQAQLDGPQKAIATYDRIEAGARDLVRRFPDYESAQALLADILMVSARRSREAGQLAASRAKAEEGLTINRRLSESRPADAPRAQAAASAESGLGMTLARMGDLPAAAQLYEKAVARNEALVAAQPRNVSFQRNLMLSYSHLGDILGYPELPNIGEPGKAGAVYEKMAALARQIEASDPQDARAATDRAIAEMRLASVEPSPAERVRKFDLALGLIRRRLEAAPTNLTMRIYEVAVLRQRGQAYLAMARPAQAVADWRASIAASDPFIEKGIEALGRNHVLATRDLSFHEPVEELRKSGPPRLEKAMALAGKGLRRAKGADEVAARAQLARAVSAYAAFYARTGQSAEAERWRRRASEEWKAISTRPEFLTTYRREMEQWEKWKP